MKPASSDLRITEIFYSLQGESTSVGLPTVFVRLTGCPLRCNYCDTAYAFQGGHRMSIDEIIARVQSFNGKVVCVTGGEPLAQPACIKLLTQLCDQGFSVSLETSGAIPIQHVDPRVTVVMDLKTPDSGESEKNDLSNLALLKPNDQIKFVLCGRSDYEWACEMIQKHQLTTCAHLLFSPSYGQLDPTTLANWILNDRLPVRFQLQLHKLLWNDTPGH
jgi:7-carboxy-7-deazaguanine synthase